MVTSFSLEDGVVQNDFQFFSYFVLVTKAWLKSKEYLALLDNCVLQSVFPHFSSLNILYMQRRILADWICGWVQRAVLIHHLLLGWRIIRLRSTLESKSLVPFIL